MHSSIIALLITTTLSHPSLTPARKPSILSRAVPPFSGLDLRTFIGANCTGHAPAHEINVQYDTYFPTTKSIQSYSLGRALQANEMLNFSTYDDGQLFVPLKSGNTRRDNVPPQCGFKFESAIVGRGAGWYVVS